MVLGKSSEQSGKSRSISDLILGLRRAHDRHRTSMASADEQVIELDSQRVNTATVSHLNFPSELGIRIDYRQDLKSLLLLEAHKVQQRTLPEKVLGQLSLDFGSKPVLIDEIHQLRIRREVLSEVRQALVLFFVRRGIRGAQIFEQDGELVITEKDRRDDRIGDPWS